MRSMSPSLISLPMSAQPPRLLQPRQSPLTSRPGCRSFDWYQQRLQQLASNKIARQQEKTHWLLRRLHQQHPETQLLRDRTAQHGTEQAPAADQPVDAGLSSKRAGDTRCKTRRTEPGTAFETKTADSRIPGCPVRASSNECAAAEKIATEQCRKNHERHQPLTDPGARLFDNLE